MPNEWVNGSPQEISGRWHVLVRVSSNFDPNRSPSAMTPILIYSNILPKGRCTLRNQSAFQKTRVSACPSPRSLGPAWITPKQIGSPSEPPRTGKFHRPEISCEDPLTHSLGRSYSNVVRWSSSAGSSHSSKCRKGNAPRRC